MSQPEVGFQITVSQRDMNTELNRLRRHGLRSPKDHVLVELARLVLIIVPFVAYLLGFVSQTQLIAYLIGYFAHRWFQKYAKTSILKRFGPKEVLRAAGRETTIEVNGKGLRLIGETSDLLLRWPCVAVSRIGDDLILRLGPEQSIPVLEKWLPEGWNIQRFEGALRVWCRS